MSDNDNAIQNPGGVGSSEEIRLKVVGTDEQPIYFRVKMNEKLGKIMKVYSERKGVLVSSRRFIYDGKDINEYDTPQGLGMDEGDEILAFPLAG